MKGLNLFIVLMLICFMNFEPMLGKRKFAPPYCLRLRFNCQRESHADHVCCRFPLPEGDEAQEEERPTPPKISIIRPGAGFKRPKNTPKPQIDENQESNQDNAGRPIETHQANHRAGSSQIKKSGQKNPGNKPHSKPRICQRVRIDCVGHPDHQCCRREDVAVTTEKPTTTTPKVIPHIQSTDYPEYDERYIQEYEENYPVQIPTECQTLSYNCDQDPNHACCVF